MNDSDWQRVWDIFEDAVARPKDARDTFLDAACGDDTGLRRSVDEMLRADEQSDSFLDRPIAGATPNLDSTDPTGTPFGRRLARGTAIGAYRILRRIGQGGMSTVYLAVRDDDAFKRRVVVKLIRPGMESEAIQQRLRTERQILAGLDHPYIARLFDGGTTDDGLPYFVLEYIEGIPIDAYCEQNRLTVDERLTLFRKVCSAVYSAHQNLVVHRDLKPSNILVTADGDPKLLDFGIAKLLNPELGSMELEPTATWHRVLTPNYASPEQVRGKMITTASDVYSLGVLLYKLLTGHLPHRLSGRSPHEIESILNDSEPLPPSVVVISGPDDGPPVEPPVLDAKSLHRRLSGDLDAIVLKALRSVPLRRYSSVEHLAGDIERYQTGQPVSAQAGTWRYRAGKFVHRHRRAVAAATTVAMVVIAFVIATTLQAARIAQELETTRRERDKKTQVLALVQEIFEHSNPYVVPGKELTVREAVERSVPVLQDGLHQQPEVRAELLHTAGSILSVLGVYDAAKHQLEEALDLRRRLHGTEHPDVIATLGALAATEKELGELDRAEELARQAVTLARRLTARPTGAAAAASLQGEPLLVRPLNELVSVLCYRSQLDDAEPLAREVMELTRQLPSSSQHLAATWHMARILSIQGNYRDAVRYNRETLALRRSRDGEHHPAQIATLNNLAMNLRRLDALPAAEQAYREAMELQDDNFGPEHANPILINNLAGVLYAMGDFAAAETHYRRALDVTVANSGEDHWTTFVFAVRIARTRIHQGAAAEAETALRRLLERWQDTLGSHWRFTEAQGVLGESLSAQQRCEAAEPILVKSFTDLLGKANDRARRDAFARLEVHLRRCGDSAEIPRYEAML